MQQRFPPSKKKRKKDFFSGDSEKWHRQDQLRLHHRSFRNPAWSASFEEKCFHNGKPFLHGIIDPTALLETEDYCALKNLRCQRRLFPHEDNQLSFHWSRLHPFFQQCLHMKTTNQPSADYDYIHCFNKNDYIHFFNNEERQIVCWKLLPAPFPYPPRRFTFVLINESIIKKRS